MPDRFIRESALISKSLAQLSHLAERLFWRLTTVADDYGRFSGEPAVIHGRCMPLLEVSLKQVSAALAELSAVDMVRHYEVDGSKYLHFVNWGKYQQTRAKKSKYPDPQASASICKQMSANAPVFVCESVSVSECDKSPTDSSDALEGPATPEPAEPASKPSAEWPEADLWLKRFLEGEQRAFNGHHVPSLLDPDYWDQLSIATNGLDKPFVSKEFAKMGIWLKNNPRRGPTPRGTRQFVAHWMQKAAEQERKRA